MENNGTGASDDVSSSEISQEQKKEVGEVEVKTAVIEGRSNALAEEKVEESNEPTTVLTDSEKDKEIKIVETSKPLLKEEEEVTFKVIFNKNKYDISFPLNMTVMDLKAHLQTIIGVPQAMQKVMIKGLAKDDRTLKDLGVSKGSKIMVVGSKLDDVLAVSTPALAESSSESSSQVVKEPFCRQKMHRKVLDKGIPDDVMPGIRNIKEALPQVPLSGMLNRSGGKVRLTFKLELDQLWIGSKERTEKIPMNNIKLVISEPIEEHEEYHILALQLGPTELSRYWIYWVPAQYVDAIKDAILGAWPM